MKFSDKIDLVEKLKNLPSGQMKEFKSLKDGSELETFLSENDFFVTDEEKADVLSHIESGNMPRFVKKLKRWAFWGKVLSVFEWLGF